MTITTNQVVGLRELMLALDQFPEKVERKMVNSALKRSAREIAKIVPSMPTFPFVRTGALLRSVRVSSVKKGRIGPVLLISIGKPRKRTFKAFGMKATVNEDAYYARFLEKGTKFIEGKKFFEQAIDIGAPRAERSFVAALKAQLDRVRMTGSL